jgi:hypothetical protein
MKFDIINLNLTLKICLNLETMTQRDIKGIMWNHNLKIDEYGTFFIYINLG